MASEEDSGDGWGGALAAVGGALIGGIGNYVGQKETNEQNLTLGREQMQFQERMSNTAYQRAVKDMEAAGINPMLASKLGGASSPPGSMPQVGNALGAGISGAQQGAAIIGATQQIGQTQATTDQIKATTEKIKSETMARDLNVEIALAGRDISQAEAKKRLEEILIARYGAASAQMQHRAMMHTGKDSSGLEDTGYLAEANRKKAESTRTMHDLARAKAEAEFYKSDWGIQNPYIKSILDILKGVSSAHSAMR